MKVHDEVCGMTFDAERAAGDVEFQGVTYYFCSDQCRGMFEEHPERYVSVIDGEEEPGDRHNHHRR